MISRTRRYGFRGGIHVRRRTLHGQRAMTKQYNFFERYGVRRAREAYCLGAAFFILIKATEANNE